jgi:transcriptional regulator with XRE-family HTH domain
MAVNKSWQLTPYGKWLKIKLAEQGMRQIQLAKMVGITPQRLTDIMYGAQMGDKYRPEIERVLGDAPPADAAS